MSLGWLITVSLGGSHNLSEPQFLPLSNGSNNASLALL